jgi:hypothetical protein
VVTITRSSALIWGIVIAFAIPICFFGASILWSFYSYNGECGGYLPWLASAKPCSMKEYVAGNLWLLVAIVFDVYWPIAIAAMGLPIIIGLIRYLIDRQNNKYD